MNLARDLIKAILREWVLLAAILDSIKWNNYPPSPQSNDEGAKEQETHHFGIIEIGGRGGGGIYVPFILSKIVAYSHTRASNLGSVK